MANFSRSAQRRVAEETRKSIAKKRPLSYPVRGPRIVTPNKVVKLTKALEPMVGETPGKGEGTLQLFDGNGFTDTKDVVKVFNLTESTLKVGSYALCNACDGFYWYTITKCSNGS